MINLLNVICYLKTLVIERFELIESPPTELEKDIAEQLLPICIKASYNSNIKILKYLVESYDSDLPNNEDDIDNDSLKHSQQLSQTQSQVSSLSEGSSYSEETLEYKNEVFSIDYIQKVIKFVDENPNCSFKTIQKNYRRIKDNSYITRFRKYLTTCGTRVDKLNNIK